MAELTNVTEKIEKALNTIRPYLQRDGGDIDFVEVTEDMTVKVRLKGACHGCPYSMQTLKAGVEQAIIQEVPEVKKVIAV